MKRILKQSFPHLATIELNINEKFLFVALAMFSFIGILFMIGNIPA